MIDQRIPDLARIARLRERELDRAYERIAELENIIMSAKDMLYIPPYKDFRAKEDAEKHEAAVDRAIATLARRRRDAEWYRKGRPQNVVSLEVKA